MTEEITVEPTKPKRAKRIGLFLTFFGMLILVCVLGFGVYRLVRINMHLAQRMTRVENNSTRLQQDMLNATANLNSFRESLEKVQALSAQQEALIQDWQAAQKGDLNKWHIAEAQYLVKLANETMQYMQNTNLSLNLLQASAQILNRIDDANLLNVKKALATDIANLQAQPNTNTTDLYLKLHAIDQQFDQLPLPASPLMPTQTVQTKIDPNLSWWRSSWEHTWQALSKIVIVRYNNSSQLPLVLPDEKMFLYQNLHAQMENALWAVLRHNTPIYSASMTRMISWVQKYFVQDAPATQSILNQLKTLSELTVQLPNIDFAKTLAAFDAYFATTQTSTNQTVQ